MENGTIKVLADHDIEGHATLLWGTLSSSGWLELIPVKLIGFEDAGLSIKSTDREVWRFAQANKMILLTNNRSMKDKDSLEQTIREENKPESLPVLTFSNRDRLSNIGYREQCADRLVEIHIGFGKLFGNRTYFYSLILAIPESYKSRFRQKKKATKWIIQNCMMA